MLIEINYMPTPVSPRMTVESFAEKFLAAGVQCEVVGERDIFFPPEDSSILFNIKDEAVVFAVFNPREDRHLAEAVQNVFESVGFQRVEGMLVDGRAEYHSVDYRV